MKLFHLGDPVLREKTVPVQEVNNEIRLLIDQMFTVMKNEDGVGLAAPQVGFSHRFFIILINDGIKRVFINPQIIATSYEIESFEEGCLSIPKIYAEVTRPSKITIQALDEKGKPFTLEADGLLARVIQHEYDHLEGVMFIDRVTDEDFKQKVEKKFLKLKEQQKIGKK
ncbi:MAG: peptide deformylase [Treponemataceae bacterium]